MNIFTSNVDFYPTPDEVINTMMIGEDVVGKIILEPQQGKAILLTGSKRTEPER